MREIYQAAIAAVHGRDRVRAALLDIAFDSPVLVVAIGKAASAMTLGALDVLGGQIECGLVITKRGYVEPPISSHQRLTIIEAGHPIPDAHSLEAGVRLVEFIAGAPADAILLFLVSGGASALVERLPRGIGLADLARANQWLQGAGLPIDAINRYANACPVSRADVLRAIWAAAARSTC